MSYTSLTLLTLGMMGALTAYQNDHLYLDNSDDIAHHLQSSFFYRHHDEGAYEYQVTGLGLQYHYQKHQETHVKIGTFFSFKDNNLFSENEFQLMVTNPLSNEFYFFPTFSKKVVLHHFRNIDELAIWATKATAYLGVGFGADLDRFSFLCQVEGFKDFVNKVTVKREDKSFSGRFFTNPYGYRAKIGLKARTFLQNWLGIEGFYSSAFDRSYKECGGQIHIEWGF